MLEKVTCGFSEGKIGKLVHKSNDELRLRHNGLQLELGDGESHHRDFCGG